MKHLARHVVIDVETAQSYDHIIEIAAVEVIGATIAPRSFVRRVKPRSAMIPFCYAVHRISLAELEQEPYFEHVIHDLIAFVGDDRIVAHNSAYEYNTLKREFERGTAYISTGALLLHDGSGEAFRSVRQAPPCLRASGHQH
jgi:DNA polymerase-3 subunit epsilon